MRVANIQIRWPDSHWDTPAEIEYLAGSLRGIADHIEKYGLEPDTHKVLTNRFGRIYGTLKMEQSQ